jgi:hypothetical protein
VALNTSFTRTDEGGLENGEGCHWHLLVFLLIPFQGPPLTGMNHRGYGMEWLFLGMGTGTIRVSWWRSDMVFKGFMGGQG